MRRAAALALALTLAPAVPAHAGGHGPAAPAAAARPTAPAPATRAAHVDPALARDIRHLLEVSGTPALALQVAHRMVQSFKKMMPNVPAAFWDRFEKKIHPKDLVDLLVPIYARHLTHKEVRALIHFYTSPVGRRLVKAMPVITAESQAAGRQFGMKIGQEAIDELKAKGYHR